VSPSSAISAGTLERTARPIAALLARGRVFVNVDAFGPEVWKLGIARVAQEQRLAAITNKHESVMGNRKLAHSVSAALPLARVPILEEVEFETLCRAHAVDVVVISQPHNR
jgi:hypothetical protein